MMMLFRAILEPMDDTHGQQAVLELIRSSPYPPTPADINRKYSEIVGAAPGENPERAISRRERERRLSQQVAAGVAAHTAKESAEFRQRHPEVAGDPAAIRKWILTRTDLPALAGENSEAHQ
jgi:hypothetical protein